MQLNLLGLTARALIRIMTWMVGADSVSETLSCLNNLNAVVGLRRFLGITISYLQAKFHQCNMVVYIGIHLKFESSVHVLH
jgi:hypothetical protein